MQEIERFFGNLFRSIVYQFQYRLTDAAERKVRETVNQQLEQLQKPKQHEKTENDHKEKTENDYK